MVVRHALNRRATTAALPMSLGQPDGYLIDVLFGGLRVGLPFRRRVWKPLDQVGSAGSVDRRAHQGDDHVEGRPLHISRVLRRKGT